MYKWFFIHQWKEKVRSLFWQKNLWMYILYGFFVVYISMVFFTMGLYIGRFLKAAFPDANPVEKFSGFLFYYFLFDFFMRFLYQGLPVLSVTPYLHLPVKRSTIFNFLLFKSLFTAFNWIPLLILLPFVFMVVVPAYSLWYAMGFLLAVIMMILINHFFVLSLKQILHGNILFIVLLLVLAGTAFYLDLKGLIPLSQGLGSFLLKAASLPVLLSIPAVILWLVFNASRNIIKREAYPENMTKDSGKKSGTADSLSFLGKYGHTGNLLRLELKLIWRNKRPKTYAFLSVFFLIYSFVFYTNPLFGQSKVMLVFIGIFLSAIFLIQYGQLLLAWDSEHFDFILTKNINIKDFYNAKYGLLILSEVIAYVLILPFGLFNREIIFINFAMLLYNMGVSTFLVLYMSVYNTAPVELNKSAFLNYQGIKAVQFLLFLGVVVVPVLIYIPFSSFGFEIAGYIFLGGLGLAGIVFRNYWITIVVNKFISRKYKIAVSYKNG